MVWINDKKNRLFKLASDIKNLTFKNENKGIKHVFWYSYCFSAVMSRLFD